MEKLNLHLLIGVTHRLPINLHLMIMIWFVDCVIKIELQNCACSINCPAQQRVSIRHLSIICYIDENDCHKLVV